MSNSFLAIYNFFDSRRVLMYCVLVGITVAMGFFASRVSFSEDITTIFPQGDKNTSIVFKGLKVKDKLIIMVSPAAVTTAEPDADRMVECGNAFVQRFKQSIDSSALESIVDIVDDQRISQTTQFIYDNLPILLTDADYARLDSLTTPRAIGEQMERNYQNIVSPMGGFVGEYIYRDPIGISGGLLAKLQKLNPESNYQIYDSHIFASDMRTMLMFVNPRLENGKIVHQDQLVDAIESSISSINDQFTELRVTYFGGPAVATYNARQIKYDTWITLNIALVLVSLVITLAFRNKWAIALIILPVIFGGLFAMAMIYLFKGSISAIAAGSGAAVFGIAMSYSIHVMAHSNNTPDPRQITVSG